MTMERHRIASLIDLYVVGVISADEIAELHRCLASSGAARAQFDRHVSNYCAVHPNAKLPTAAEFLAQTQPAEPVHAKSLSSSTLMQVVHIVRPYLRGWRAG